MKTNKQNTTTNTTAQITIGAMVIENAGIPRPWMLAARDMNYSSVEAWADAMLSAAVATGKWYALTGTTKQMEVYGNAALPHRMTLREWATHTLNHAAAPAALPDLPTARPASINPAIPPAWQHAAAALGHENVEAWAVAMLDAAAWPADRLSLTCAPAAIGAWCAAARSQGQSVSEWVNFTLSAAAA
jgi:hypothetical protein